MKSRPLQCASMLCCLAVASPAPAATLEVDSGGGTPYQTIQSAVDAALAGVDDVFVRCGLYQENVLMRDQVSVRGQSADCAIIDGGQSGSVVTMIGLGVTTTLEGFTIRNGLSELGGGIFVEDGSPTITNNVIEQNSAVVGAGFTGVGGGILVEGPPLRRATTEPVITRNIIRNNSAGFAGGGIEVDIDAAPTISDNLFVGNVAVEYGGAIDVFGNSNPVIVNNTIVRNCLQGGATACAQGGGAISIVNSTAEIFNNVIAWNEAGSGAGGIDAAGSAANLGNNDAFQNQPANYGGVADPTGSNGNISTDPMFVDQRSTPAGFQPRSDSPLIDGGSVPLAPANDLRGVPRPLDGDADGTPLPDIGARENEGVTRLVFVAATDFSWDSAAGGGGSYNVYRGDLQALVATGIYTQDPVSVSGARQWCGLAMPSSFDTDPPDPDQTLFYLVVLDGAVEGTLGFDGVPLERPFTNRCP